jgi:cell division septum initiation protein DivIVA
VRIAPDLRQQRFRTASRVDRTEVVAFLTEAADDYEHALREIDRLRQDLLRMEAPCPNTATARPTSATRS